MYTQESISCVQKIREYVFFYMKILLPQKSYPFVCQSKKKEKKKKKKGISTREE
jgi:hypothetical protein